MAAKKHKRRKMGKEFLTTDDTDFADGKGMRIPKADRNVRAPMRIFNRKICIFPSHNS